MIAFSNCKINLGLNVIDKRNDGFHNLSTCFYPINVCDVLEIIKNDTFKFEATGIPIYSTVEQNLIVKAYRLLQQDFKQIGNVSIHLHKNIPTGAGVGGGSANASYALTLLNDLFSLQLSTEQLLSYAAILGSDCPFFIHNKPCIASGRGELLQPFQLDLSDYYLLLVFPKAHVSTKDAFANIIPKQPQYNIAHILQQPIETWQHQLTNDFETTVFVKYPELLAIKNKLYDNKALYASMSGSGSSIYGIYSSASDAQYVADEIFAGFHAKVLQL